MWISDIFDSLSHQWSVILDPFDLISTNKTQRTPFKRPFHTHISDRDINTIAAKAKHVKRGVKEVVKGLRKGEKGLVLIAGDISPIDVITHVPVLCEENDVPYIFLPSKEDLGTAGSTKRPTSCVMVVLGGKKKDMEGAKDYKELYDECFAKVKEMVCVFLCFSIAAWATCLFAIHCILSPYCRIYLCVAYWRFANIFLTSLFVSPLLSFRMRPLPIKYSTTILLV